MSREIPLLKKSKKIEALEKLTGKKSNGTNYITEATFLAAAGLETIILGPGPINAHIADEFISFKSLEKCTVLYKQIINS